MPFFIKYLLVPLWLSLLFLPFRGVRGALILFVSFLIIIPAMKTAIKFLGKWTFPKSIKIRSVHIYAVFLTLALVLPLAASDYMIDIAVLAGIYMILALGLNVVVGFTGLLNLGFAAYYAIGAYTYAILSTKLGMGFWTALPFSVGLSAFAGVLLSLPALRLRGDYLAIVTLGFGEIVRLILNNWDGMTNGPNGISGIPRPEIAGVYLARPDHYYYFVLSMVVFAVVVVRNVCSSKIGRAWISIREDEVAASSIGINTMTYKIYAFAFGAFWAGLGGALFASKLQFVSPESFTFMESVLIICMVILGGLGSIPGSLLGAAILVGLPELLREFQLYRMLVLGGGLVALMIFRPQGLLGSKNVSS